VVASGKKDFNPLIWLTRSRGKGNKGEKNQEVRRHKSKRKKGVQRGILFIKAAREKTVGKKTTGRARGGGSKSGRGEERSQVSKEIKRMGRRRTFVGLGVEPKPTGKWTEDRE